MLSTMKDPIERQKHLEKIWELEGTLEYNRVFQQIQKLGNDEKELWIELNKFSDFNKMKRNQTICDQLNAWMLTHPSCTDSLREWLQGWIVSYRQVVAEQAGKQNELKDVIAKQVLSQMQQEFT